MKKTFFLAFTLYSSASAMAQAVLTSASFPAAGEVFISTLADTGGVSTGAAGPGVTWDFSTLVNSGQMQTDSFKTVASTPYAATFSSSGSCQHTITPTVNTFVYFNNTGTAVDRTGNVDPSTSTTVVYSNTARQYQFPFTFGNSFSDTYSAIYTITAGTVHANGSTTATADSYGTLTTPLGTYANVDRITSVRNEIDSVFTSSGTVIINATVVYTNWYQAVKFFPVLSIVKTDVTTSIGPPSHNKTVAYWLGTPTGINDMTKENNSIAFPNPAAEKVTIRYNLEGNSMSFISVTDTKGAVVFSKNEAQHAGEQNVEIDAGKMENGIYLYSVKTAEGNFNGRIVICR